MKTDGKKLRTGKILKPNQPGTKKWVEKYGGNLICVRYKYDDANNRKVKTVELLVEEKEWEKKSGIIPQNKLIRIRIDYEEIQLRKIVKAAGGRWDKNERIWKLAYGQVIALGLEGRISNDEKGK